MMMAFKQKKRVSVLTHILHQENEVSIKEISEMMHVSQMTIRRDLDVLERQGIIKRTHGGAVLLDPNTSTYYSEQKTRNIYEKKLIGIKASSLVQPNDIIFLDSGTTTPFIANNINPDIPITVICYTLTNALEFFQRSNANLILFGGLFHRESNIFYSAGSNAIIRNSRADKAFISTGGFDPEMGLTTFFDYEAIIKREMIRSAKRIILVADSTKFGKISINHFAELEDIDTVITDNGISNEYRQILMDCGVELIIANHVENDFSAKEE